MSYAHDVTTKYPFIEWQATGGGCDCLAMRASDGGWLVLASDCAVPESADDAEMMALVRYPHEECGGWGDDGENGEIIMENKPAGECVAYMVAHHNQVPEFADNVYQCFWGDGYPKLGAYDSRTRDAFFFTDDNGFSEADRVAIQELEIGRAHTVESMMGQHVTVVREA